MKQALGDLGDMDAETVRQHWFEKVPFSAMQIELRVRQDALRQAHGHAKEKLNALFKVNSMRMTERKQKVLAAAMFEL